MEAEKAAKKLGDEAPKKPPVVKNKQKQQRQIDSDEDDETEDDNSDNDKTLAQNATAELDAVKEIQCKAEQRKAFLMQLMSNRVCANFKLVL